MSAVSESTDKFAIKTEVFEGPMELLLDLVEKRKLLINDISLAEVTDEYLQQVSLMQELSLPNTSQFVSLAATLLLIKSKSLLPVLDFSEEELGTIDDLEERLKLYQIYRDAAKAISERFGSKVMHRRRYVMKAEPIFLPDDNCTVEQLREAIQRVVSDLPVKEVRSKVQLRKVVSLEEMVERLHKRIETQVKLRFSDLLENDQEKTTVIVGFLAILESVKQGSILVAQISRFEEIEIEKERAGIPKYY